MSLKLDRLLKTKMRLRRKKYALITSLNTKPQHYFLAYNSINALKIIILREKAANNQILNEIKRLHKMNMPVMPLMEDLHKHTENLSLILDDEYKILKEVSLLKASAKKPSILVFKNRSRIFLKEKLHKLAKIFGNEEEINKNLIDSINGHVEKLAIKTPVLLEKHKEFSEIKDLLNTLITTYKQFLYELNPKKANEEARKILAIIGRLQKTELYGYMKSDFIAIQKMVIKIMKNPREHKLGSVLAGAYIIAPGTFELTFAILMARYSYKYAIKKFSNKQFFKKAY